jgi:hypothetical protein
MMIRFKDEERQICFYLCANEQSNSCYSNNLLSDFN